MNSESSNPNDQLTPSDAAAIDALAERGFAASGGDEKTQAWRAFMAEVGGQFGEVPPVSQMLVEKTLAAVSRQTLPMPVKEKLLGNPRMIWWRRYAREIGASAIAASIFAAVVVLGLEQARQSGNRVACAENLGVVARGFATYAIASGGALPSLGNSGDHNWLAPNLSIPGSHSNTDNLLPLMNASLIKPANLVCPGGTEYNKNAAGYSYLNLFGPVAYSWSGSHNEIVLADRNPLFVQANTGVDPNANSFNHAGHGTYVLRGDASVTWEGSPNIGPDQDNIWTVKQGGGGGQVCLTYAGTEVSSSASDVFLSP